MWTLNTVHVVQTILNVHRCTLNMLKVEFEHRALNWRTWSCTDFPAAGMGIAWHSACMNLLGTAERKCERRTVVWHQYSPVPSVHRGILNLQAMNTYIFAQAKSSTNVKRVDECNSVLFRDVR